MPEWVIILVAFVFWGMGFLTCGALIGNTSFWDGVRYIWSFGAKKK